MLSKDHRLTRTEFGAYFPKGKRLHSSSLMVVFSPHERLKASAVISKRIAKTAVERNKFRRRVYAVFEEMYRQEGSMKGVFICIAKEHAVSVSRMDLKAELRALIHKTGVLG
jgi:ribonuclease P protein component